MLRLESVKPVVLAYPGQRPSMGGSRINIIPINCFHETLTRCKGRGLEWKYGKCWGYRPRFLSDGPLKIFIWNLNISKRCRAILGKFSQIPGLHRPCLCFRSEVAWLSNFEGSGGQSCRKWHIGLRVGRLGRVSVKLYDR